MCKHCYTNQGHFWIVITASQKLFINSTINNISILFFIHFFQCVHEDDFDIFFSILKEVFHIFVWTLTFYEYTAKIFNYWFVPVIFEKFRTKLFITVMNKILNLNMLFRIFIQTDKNISNSVLL